VSDKTLCNNTSDLLDMRAKARVRVRDKYGRVDVVPHVSWKRAPPPVWVDAQFNKYAVLEQTSSDQYTCIRRTPTPTDARIQCNACYNKHRATNATCLGNMPGAKNPMKVNILYNIKEEMPEYEILSISINASRERNAWITLVVRKL
jgi:hypothetical protein